jgi:hypothetical protein
MSQRFEDLGRIRVMLTTDRQTCRYCENPDAIISPETCCTGCTVLAELKGCVTEVKKEVKCPKCNEILISTSENVSFNLPQHVKLFCRDCNIEIEWRNNETTN